ncbi:protein SON isoform X2 [Dendropsophus ebraccatus]|uniref:protein SON isoform X2 n=1 Tax=Dendropsophus ebraccatus TaxID=150705 RepID=UPI003831E763
MATNIEQIFRSFVVNKFKEIQEENRNSENMDSSHNGELTAPGKEDASEGSSVVTQNEGSSQTIMVTEDTESQPMEVIKSQSLASEEKESESKDLKTTDLSSDDDAKKDLSKKKSKKHKKHKSKKKKKKKKKEKNEKRSKSTSSFEDQEDATSESKSVWQPVIASPREQDTSNTLSSQVEENVDPLPSLGGQDLNVDSEKEQPTMPQLDIDSGFFGPKCPNEMHFPVSSSLIIAEAEIPEQSKEPAVEIIQNDEKKINDQNSEKQHTNCETAEALQNKMSLPQPDLVLLEEKSVELQENRLDSEKNKQLDSVSSPPLQPQSKSSSASLSKSTAKSRSRSNSLAKETRSRSKSLTKVPKKQASSKSLTRHRSRSSSVVRRRRSRSSSAGQRRRSKSKSPVRRRRSRSSTPARYSKSPIRSWWSKSIRNRQRSVSIERRRRSRTRSPAKRRRSRSRSSEKRRYSRTRSSAKRVRSRSRSANRRRKSRSTSRKHRLRSRSASRRKSKSISPIRKQKSKSASPLRRQKSKTTSPVRRARSRSRSAVQKRRSRSGAASRRRRSRSGSGSRRRKSRSISFTRRRRSRSGSAFRRHRSKSAVASRRRRSRSPSVTQRRRSKSPSVSRRRRSRSVSASRRHKSRSTSASRRRRSRSVSRRRRSRSASRRRRSRSTSVSRRRKSRSVSRRRRSGSTSRRRKSRSASRRRRSRSASRRRKSRSISVSRRHKSRSASRRRRSRSDSASRRRRSRSGSVSRRRRSKSDSASRRRRSRLGSTSKRRKSRSGSDTRRPRSSSQQKSQSYSATKLTSRSTSVSRGEQSTLLSSASRDKSPLQRRSRSKEGNRKSRSGSASVKLISVEMKPTLESKSSTEQRLPETVSLDKKQPPLSVMTVEKDDGIKPPDESSTLVTESKSCSSPLKNSPPETVQNNKDVEVEPSVLECSSTASVLDDQMKSANPTFQAEQVIPADTLFEENHSEECDMDIEPLPYTPIQIICAEGPTEVVHTFETSKETFAFDAANDHTKLVDVMTDEEPKQKNLGHIAEDGTMCKPFGGSSDLSQPHGLSQLAREYKSESCAVPVEDPTSRSCRNKYENVESTPEFAKGSVSVLENSLKAAENSEDHIALSPLQSCIGVVQESAKCWQNADYVPQKDSDCSSLTVKQDIPVFPAENQVEYLHSSLPIEGRPLDLSYNKQENIMAKSLLSNEGLFPGSQKHTERDVSASKSNDAFSQQISTPNFMSSTIKENSSDEKSDLAAEQRFPSSSEQSSSHEPCVSNETETGSTSSYITQSFSKEHVSNDSEFKEVGGSKVSHLVENETVEIKPVKENKQILSSTHISEDISRICEVKAYNLPVSLPYERTNMNASQTHEVDRQNVKVQKKENNASTSMKEIPISLNMGGHEFSKFKEPTTNLTANVLSAKTSDSSFEKDPSVELVKKGPLILAEVTMEIQRHEIPSNTKNTESSSDGCKIVPKPSPFTSVNVSCPKQEVDKFLQSDAAQVKSSVNSATGSEEVIHHFEKTSHSREQNSLSYLHSEKQCLSSSKAYDGNLECVQKGLQENELPQNIVEQVVSNTEIDGEGRFGNYIPKRHSVNKHSESVTKKSDSIDDIKHVNDGREESIKSGSVSSPDLYIQQELVPKNKALVHLEKESSFQPLTDIKEPELKTHEQRTSAYAKHEPAYIGLKESMPHEDPKLSSKPFLETGRLSVPVQFKFSKTFKTLGVSQLCTASEDSSDVEGSKVNTSSSGVTRNTTASTSGASRSSSKTLTTSQQTANVSVEPSKAESSQDVSTERSQSDSQAGHDSETDLSQPDNVQAADDLQTSSSTKHSFPHISNAASKLGVKQRQYRSRSVAQDSRTPSVDRGHASRSRSKSVSRRRRSKSSSRKKRSSSTARKKSSHSKSVRRKRSRSRSRGRKGRSQSKSKGKKKRSTSKLSGKRKHSRSKSSERTGGSKSLGKQRSSRSASKTRKKSKSPAKKGRSRSKSESKKNSHSKTSNARKRSRSKSLNRRRKSRSKSLSSRSRSRSVSASRKPFTHSKSSLHRKRSQSSSRSASPRRRSRSRNKRRSLSRSPAARSHSRSRSRWHRSRSRGRWRRSRSLSTSRHRSRSTSRQPSSTKKRKSLSPVRRRRSRSQVKQKDKSPVGKRKSTSPPPPLPPPQKKTIQPKPAGFKHSIGLKSLIQKQLSQAKSQGSTGKLSKEPLTNVTSRTQLSAFSARSQASVSNLNTMGQITIPNLAEVPLPSVSSGSQIPMPSVPPAEPLSVSSLAAETQLSVPDLTAANQWHVPDMSGAAWSVPDIAAGAHWSMADLGAGAQWPNMSDLTAGSHWPMHDMSVGAQWSMPDLAAGTQWAVPDVASGAQWAMPDLAAGTQWTVPDLHAGSQWAMTNLAAGAQWAVPDLAATAQWTVPDITAGAHMQRVDLAPEAQVPGSDLAPEAQVPGSDLAAEAQVPGSDMAAEAQVPGFDMVGEAQVPLEHDLTSQEHNMMPDVAAEALVPVASSTVVPDVAAGIPLPDVAVAAQMPVPDVAATINMPDVATEAQKQMSDFVATQSYVSLTPEEPVEDPHFREPVPSSEHQTESESCEAFVEQSSFEPHDNTSLNQKMEESLSSGQQVPLDFYENSQSTEVSDQTVLVDKPDPQLHQDSELDIPLNVPQVAPTMDSESHLCSDTSSDVPCERSDYSVHSVSVESAPSQDHSLIDSRLGSDTPVQCEPHASSSNFAESKISPIQTDSVKPTDDHKQPLLAVKTPMADTNLQVEPYSSGHMQMEEPYASPNHVLQNEPSVNSNSTLDIKSHSISDNEIEACVPNHSQVERISSPTLSHPTNRYASPEHRQLVEPYASPHLPQLVEPYTSPVRPQLVEPHMSPEHPPLVELYSSPEQPQLVEPYASPEFPQLVEPYASPDRQQLVEPYSETEHIQSPVLAENTFSPAEKPEESSTAGHILTYAAVTCTQINTDSSCSNDLEVKSTFSLEYPVTSDVLRKQDQIDSEHPQLSNSNHAGTSLQEVPCPNLLKDYSLESSFSPKETSAEECSQTERQLVEPSIESHFELPTSPVQLLTAQLCSPHTVNKDEPFPITEHKSLNCCSSPDEPKLDLSSIITNQQQLSVESVESEQSKSKDLSSAKEVFQSCENLNSELVQEKLYSIQVHPQEDYPTLSVQRTVEPCLNAAEVPFTEYEHPSAEGPKNDPDNLCIPVLSNTIINLHSGDQSCTVLRSQDRPEQDSLTKHSHSEESNATSGSNVPDKVDKLLDKPSPSPDLAQTSSLSRNLSDCHNSFFPEHLSNADHSMLSEYSTKTNESNDHNIKTGDFANKTSDLMSQECDRCDENTLSTKNSSFPADVPCLNPDDQQCVQDSNLSMECVEHKLNDSTECIKTDNTLTTTPPDLLPYDSDQPTDMCSEPSSEPVPFNSQPPPELLPYDSEQPANSFLSISDYSTEQGSSDFHAPPELLPYNTDQPIVLHKQQTEPTVEELPIYDSGTIQHETNKTSDLPSVDCGNSASLGIHKVPEKCEPSIEIHLELNSVKETSSGCTVAFTSTEHTSSDTIQENLALSAVLCTQEDTNSSGSSIDKHLPTPENDQLVVQTVLSSDTPEDLTYMGENQTESFSLLTDVSEKSEGASSSELVNTSESATILPLQDEISVEAAKNSSPKSLVKAECPQPVSRKTDPMSDLEKSHEYSRSRSIDRKTSRSKSVSKNKRSRSKSVTPTKKSLTRSRRSKSRSASTESNKHSPVLKRKESYAIHKRSSRSPSVGRRKRSRSSSVSPKKRSRSSSVIRRNQRKRSRSQSGQRRSHSPSDLHKQSRSPSVRRRSRSPSATRRRRSPSSSVTRKKSSPSPATRRRRSPSATRRRRSPSTSSRRRRTPSPVSRRRRSPSATRRRRSRSPSATRRRWSPSPSTTRRRRSPSPSVARRRRSPSPSVTRRRRSPSPSVTRRRRSPSPSTTRRKRSSSPAATRKRRSPSPSATRRRRSPSPPVSRRRRSPSSEFRRKRSPSLPVSHKRNSHSPSVPRKRRSRSTSASRRRRSRSASQRKRSRSPSAPRKRRSKSKSPSKSPTGVQSKSDRSRSLSHTDLSRKRKTRSRSSSRDKKTVEKRRKRSSSKDSSKDYYSVKQRRKSRTPPRRKKSRSPGRRASVCKSPVRRRRSRSPVRRKSFSRSPIRRKRSRSRDKSMDSARSPKRLTDLDKAQLLEIAKANAAAMCAKAGVPLPPSLKPAITPAAPADEKITHRTYGVTIQELTEKCKQIAQSKEDDVIVNKPHDSDDEEEDRPFYNHPFKVSEHKPISFSLLNPSLKPAPKNQVTLTKEFPVSSGSQHRKKEDKVYGEWVPVDKNSEESKDDVFTNTGPAQPVDITSAMNERAVAQTRLTGNPYDIEALYMLNRAQEQIDAWAQSTSIPGQFTGSTGAQVLSAEEISNSGPQAWLKKDQFLKAAPVTGGRGALLMRKMGWKEGEGLGRNNEGNVDPILLDFKTDRKGLVADGEKASNKLALPAMKDLSGKHPISALMELCNKKKWSPPEFELVDDTGPEHRKRFLFRVTVNGVLCQPSQPSVTKKLAKATAAAAALQALGALPKENMTSTSNFCSASTSTL